MARSSWIAFGLSLAMMVCSARFAQAGFVPGFTGNSQTLVDGSLVSHPASDGLINFAVWDNSAGGNWITDFLTAYGVSVVPLTALVAADPFAPYVYLYQVVNTNPVAPDSPLHLFQVQGGEFDPVGGYLLSAGTGVGFNELVAAVPTVTGPTSNVALGTTDALPGDGIPGAIIPNTDLDAIPFAAVAGAETPTGLTHLVAENLWQFEFPDQTTSGGTDHSLAPSVGYSTIVFLTSDRVPTYLPGRVHNGDVTYGDIPSNTPEPGSFAMAFGAIVVGLAAVAGAAKKTRKSA
jgi:hypothetical protein